MPRKNNFYLIIFAEISFLFFILIVIPTIFLKEKQGIYQISFENILSLDINHSYIQSFISDKDNLNSISVLLKNPELKNSDLISLEILNSKKENLQTLKISSISVEDPNWIRFKFSPIKSKKGDIFYIKVTSNNNKDNSLYIYGIDNNNINFKTTFTAINIKESFRNNLNQQINNFKSRNIFQTGFYLFTIVLINFLILI